ncbi:MAG TPA: PHP domain-containing protein, partial [Vicinamibacteria bacterium]
AAIHAQGGLAFAPHPFFRDRPLRRRRAMDGVGRLLPGLAVDAVEVINSTPCLEWANLRARRFARRHGLPALGASDAHILAAVGKGYTCFPGRGAADLRRALQAGAVSAGSERYTPGELLAYLRFWFAYDRRAAPRRPAAVARSPRSHREGAAGRAAEATGSATRTTAAEVRDTPQRLVT